MAHTSFPFVQYLSTNGDGSGLVNQAGTWSVANPGFFRMEAQPGTSMHVHRLAFSIADNSTFQLSNYGSLPALVQGIQVEAKFGDHVIDSFDGFRVRQNQEWFSLGDTKLNILDGPGRVLTCEIPFAPNFGITLHLEPGDYIGVRLRDDLSGLIEQLAVCTGRISFLFD